MSLSKETEKLRHIYQLLFDLATGKRTFTLASSLAEDEYDQILMTLSLLRERLQELVLEKGIVPPYYSYEHIVPLIFVLDSGFRITDYNTSVIERLNYSEAAIHDRLFDELLDIPSKKDWIALLEKVSKQSGYLETIELRFLTYDNHFLPLFCMVSDALSQPHIFVLSIDIYLKETFYLNSITNELTEKIKKEVALIEKVHTYILEHLDDPYLSVKSLALLFGCEQHKLSSNFRAYYHISIYQFYHDERLKKAYLLIQQTDIPLKEIAYQCGFGMYLNFYKAFKKKYGFSPSALSRG